MTTETVDAAGPGRGGRMSRQRKRDAVLRLLRGEPLEIAMSEASLTGFQSWLESGPPGTDWNRR